MINRVTPSLSEQPQGIGVLNRERARIPKTSERIARELVDFILSRDLPEGERLPAEHDMVSQLGVSRSTVREALRLLESRGAIIVKTGRNGGPVVRRPRPEDLSEALTLMLQFEDATMVDVLQARIAFEPMIARLAAPRIKRAELRALERVVSEMHARLDDYDDYLDSIHRFHTMLADASGNPVLRIFTGTLKSLADGAVVGIRASRERREDVAAAHTRVVEALASRDADAAEAAVRSHLQDADRYWLDHYGPLVRKPIRWIH